MGRLVCALVFTFVSSGALTACAGGESFADENAALRVQLETLTSELDEAAEMDAELIELRAQVEALLSELDETAAANEVADALGLADKVVELRSQVEALTSQLDEAEVEMGEVSSENSELQSRVEDLEASLAVAEPAATTTASTTTTTTAPLATTTTTTTTTTLPPTTTTTINFGRTGTTTTVATGSWKRTELTDGMDGLKSVTVRLRGNPKVSGWLGDKHSVYLDLDCYKEEKQWVTIFLSGEDLDHNYNGDTVIRMKFDEEDTYSLTSGGYSYTGTFFLASSYDSPGPIVDKLLNATTLKVELTPYNYAPQIVTFKLAGLAPLLPELRELCNW